MNSRNTSLRFAPHVTIRVSGQLFQGHLAYLDQLVQSAVECELWTLLNLSNLRELDGDALCYLIEGENRRFGLVGCPSFIRERIDQERDGAAA